MKCDDFKYSNAYMYYKELDIYYYLSIFGLLNCATVNQSDTREVNKIGHVHFIVLNVCMNRC